MALLPYSCGCAGQGFLNTNPTVKSGDRCICANDYRNICSKGPDPCSDTWELDLTDYVENGINDSETFELVSFDDGGFSSVTVSSAGILNVTTSGKGGKEYKIEYKVSTVEDGVTYAVNGYVYLCFKNLCRGVSCPDGEECENCTGDCVPSSVDLNS